MSSGPWRKLKRCNRCGGDFPRTNEYFSSSGLHRGYCKPCGALAVARSIAEALQAKKPKHQSSRWLRSKWRQLKERSLKKKVSFDLDMDFMREKFALTHCEFTGIEFEKTGPFSKSLDRVSPLKGYVEDNVKMVVYIHNVARGAWGDEALARYVAALVKRAKNSSPNYRHP